MTKQGVKAPGPLVERLFRNSIAVHGTLGNLTITVCKLVRLQLEMKNIEMRLAQATQMQCYI